MLLINISPVLSPLLPEPIILNALIVVSLSAELVQIPGRSHFPFTDFFRRFAQRIRSFSVYKGPVFISDHTDDQLSYASAWKL